MAKLKIDIDVNGSRKIKETSDALGGLEKKTIEANKAFKLLSGTIATYITAEMGKQLIDYADRWSLINNKLQLVTKSSTELVVVQKELFQISQDTHADMTATAKLYSSLSFSAKQLGLTHKDLLKVTTAVNKSLIISGASATEASSTVIQFSQALASGVLRGDEFNSMSENAPRLMKVLRDSLGKTSGELRKMAADGKLSSEIVASSIIKQSQVLDKEFKSMKTTVGQSLQDVSTSFMKLIGDIDTSTGASEHLAEALKSVSGSFNDTGIKDYQKEIDYTIASISYAVDYLDFLYETVENTVQNVANGISGMVYMALEPVLMMISKVVEGMEYLGLASSSSVKSVIDASKKIHELALKNAENIVGNNKELEEAFKKLGISIDARVDGYRKTRELSKKELETQKEIAKVLEKKEVVAKEDSKIKEAIFNRELAFKSLILDSSSKEIDSLALEISMYSDKLAKQKEGSLEYINTQTKIYELADDLQTLEKKNEKENLAHKKEAVEYQIKYLNLIGKTKEAEIKSNELLIQKLKEKSDLTDKEIDDYISKLNSLSSDVQFGKIFAQSLSSSLSDGIQDSINGKFNFNEFAKSFSQSIGSSLTSSSIDKGVSDIASTTAGISPLAGLGLGIGISAIGALFGDNDRESAEERATKNFNKFIDGLDKASEALLNFGNEGTDIRNTLSALGDKLSYYKNFDLNSLNTRQGGKSTHVSFEGSIYSTGVFGSDSDKGLARVQKDINLKIKKYTAEINNYLSDSISDFLSADGLSKSELEGITGLKDGIAAFDVKLKEATKTANIHAEAIKKIQQQEGLSAKQIEDKVNLYMKENDVASALTDQTILLNKDYKEHLGILREMEEARQDEFKSLSDDLELLNAKTDAERIEIKHKRILAGLINEENKTIQKAIWLKEEELKRIAEVEAATRKSNENKISWMRRNETLEDSVKRLSGGSMNAAAKNLDELSKLFKELSNSKGGLTDTKLERLKANEAYINSVDDERFSKQKDYADKVEVLEATLRQKQLAMQKKQQDEQIKREKAAYYQMMTIEKARLSDIISSTNNKISSLSSTFGSLNSIIDSLNGATASSSTSLLEFNKSMSRALNGGSVEDAVQKSSVLFKADTFSSSKEARFEQSKASNQFKKLSVKTEKQIDVLRQIAKNTEMQLIRTRQQEEAKKAQEALDMVADEMKKQREETRKLIEEITKLKSVSEETEKNTRKTRFE